MYKDGDTSDTSDDCNLMLSLIDHVPRNLFQEPLFMIRVAGSIVYFYSHKFSDDLLDSVSKGTEPMEPTLIQKLAVVENGVKRHGFSLFDSEDRARIFNVLDCIQQIVTRF
jgi:hypothetical protein